MTPPVPGSAAIRQQPRSTAPHLRRQNRIAPDQSGARGGSRTLIPRRAGGFKPPAYAVPPPGPTPTLRRHAPAPGPSALGRSGIGPGFLRGGFVEGRSHSGGGDALKAVRHDDALDHVCYDVDERPPSHCYRNDDSTRHPPHGPHGPGQARRAAERRGVEAGRPRSSRQTAGHVGEADGRCRFHSPIQHRGCDTHPGNTTAGLRRGPQRGLLSR